MAETYEPNYEVVVDFGDLIWTGVGYGTHGLMLGLELFLALFLLMTGAVCLARPQTDSPVWRRLGAAELGSPNARGSGFLRLVLGAFLLLPVAVQAPWLVSLLASTVAIGLLISIERGVPKALRSQGRLLRSASILAAVLTSAFIVWEQDDSIAIGGRVLLKMQDWRTHELSWQISNDEHSPKVGQAAPDFELSDPTGTVTARLSDSRDKRPVALIFGSYT